MRFTGLLKGWKRWIEWEQRSWETPGVVGCGGGWCKKPPQQTHWLARQMTTLHQGGLDGFQTRGCCAQNTSSTTDVRCNQLVWSHCGRRPLCISAQGLCCYLGGMFLLCASIQLCQFSPSSTLGCKRAFQQLEERQVVFSTLFNFHTERQSPHSVSGPELEARGANFAWQHPIGEWAPRSLSRWDLETKSWDKTISFHINNPRAQNIYACAQI